MNTDSLSNSQYNEITKKRKNPNYAWIPYYRNSVILGDSISESILDFRLLLSHNTIARRGYSVDQITDAIAVVSHLHPKVLFMEFGKNDIVRFHGNEVLFIEEYRKQINSIQLVLPQTDIFINSIIPLRHDVMLKLVGFQAYERFNRALKIMCQEDGLGYIDNTGLMNWGNDVYEYDGIHPKYPYYLKWLKHMANIAELKP